MKQQLDELRTLARALFEAGQQEKRKQPPEVWGETRNLKFRDCPSETTAVMDAMAFEAFRRLGPISNLRQQRNELAAALGALLGTCMNLAHVTPEEREAAEAQARAALESLK